MGGKKDFWKEVADEIDKTDFNENSLECPICGLETPITGLMIYSGSRYHLECQNCKRMIGVTFVFRDVISGELLPRKTGQGTKTEHVTAQNQTLVRLG